MNPFYRFVRDRFNLQNEQDDHNETIKSIERGVEFRGVNVWTLVFAIFVASVGLNVNSAAVIIGAMLISPLMGPIMGVGLSLGIYDFDLLKRSLKNLGIAVGISVITSSFYFSISPLNEVQSELLARTTPTIYDVLIALFGGLAGIVAGATKEKGNAIPGVAIATALMPPLCTAGFGLATGNYSYFIGAFYLFFINAVMISLSTFLIVRLLKFPHRQLVDEKKRKSLVRYVVVIVSITVLPSIYLAYQIVEESVFKKRANEFVRYEFVSSKTHVVNKSFSFYNSDSSKIEVLLAGKILDEERIEELKSRLSNYALQGTRLVILQGQAAEKPIDVSQLKSGIIEDLYRKNELALNDKDKRIKLLEQELAKNKATSLPVKQLGEEIHAIFPEVISASIANTEAFRVADGKTEPITYVVVKLKSSLNKTEEQRLNNWIKKRLGVSSVKVVREM